LLLKYSLTRFGSEVSASKKREETNETDSPAKKKSGDFLTIKSIELRNIKLFLAGHRL